MKLEKFSLAETMEFNNTLRLDISKYVMKEKELENINQTLKDEHQALQLAFASLEEKLRKAQVCFFLINVNYLLFNILNLKKLRKDCDAIFSYAKTLT